MNWDRWVYGKRYMQLRTDGERESFKRGYHEGVLAIVKPLAVQLILAAAVSAAAVIGLDLEPAWAWIAFGTFAPTLITLPLYLMFLY